MNSERPTRRQWKLLKARAKKSCESGRRRAPAQAAQGDNQQTPVGGSGGRKAAGGPGKAPKGKNCQLRPLFPANRPSRARKKLRPYENHKDLCIKRRCPQSETASEWEKVPADRTPGVGFVSGICRELPKPASHRAPGFVSGKAYRWAMAREKALETTQNQGHARQWHRGRPPHTRWGGCQSLKAEGNRRW